MFCERRTGQDETPRFSNKRSVPCFGTDLWLKAAAFYRKYGFLELPKIERRFFLPMGTVEELFR